MGGVLCGFLRSFSGEWCRVYTVLYSRMAWWRGILPYIALCVVISWIGLRGCSWSLVCDCVRTGTG